MLKMNYEEIFLGVVFLIIAIYLYIHTVEFAAKFINAGFFTLLAVVVLVPAIKNR